MRTSSSTVSTLSAVNSRVAVTDSSLPANVRTFERAAEGEKDDFLRPFKRVVPAGDAAFPAEVEHAREAIFRCEKRASARWVLRIRERELSDARVCVNRISCFVL